MAEVKKHANGGTYYVTVPDPPKASPKPKQGEKPKLVVPGWNTELNPDKK